MYPAAFEYLEPRTLREAVEMLHKYGEDARILAGGQSLVPLMKLRLARPKYLIDLNRVPGLSYIKEDDGSLVFGPLTRHFEIEQSALVQAKIPMMRKAASVIGDSQVRNLGSIGGALVEADPAGDWGPVILALDARIKCVGLQGERILDAKDFFTSAYTTALRADEVATEIVVPIRSAPSTGIYLKLERVAGDFAIVSVALQIDLDSNGVCRAIGIGLGGVNETPTKAVPVEQFMRGQKISRDVMETASHKIQELASPIGDVRGSSEYKKEVLGVVFKRALERLTTTQGASTKV